MVLYAAMGAAWSRVEGARQQRDRVTTLKAFYALSVQNFQMKLGDMQRTWKELLELERGGELERETRPESSELRRRVPGKGFGAGRAVQLRCGSLLKRGMLRVNRLA